VWASNPTNKAMYRHKSLPLELLLPRLLPALHHDLIELHSLQVGDAAQQLMPYASLDGVHNWNGKLQNFSDTAHVVHQLDLLISVDTAVAHVAGGLDKPTWLLLQHNADFRWLRGRSDSPWYPCMSLIRQNKLGNWPSAVSQLQERLTLLLG